MALLLSSASRARGNGLSAPSNGLTGLTNNTASWWFCDPGLRRLAVAIGVGYLATINSGYDLSLLTGLMANPLFMHGLDNPAPNKLGIIVAALPLGGIFSLPFAPFLADRWGRRFCMGVGYLFMLAGAFTQTFTTGGWNMMTGRFVLGFGIHMVGVAASPYVAELSHPRFRPQATAMVNTCFYVGSSLSAWVSFGALYIRGQWSWRLCCLLQAPAPVLALLLLPFLPESPRFLVAKGRGDEAHRTLAKYHANGDLDDQLVLHELWETKEAIQAEKTAVEGTTYSSFLKTPGNRHRLCIVVMVAFYSQWVGNGALSYFLVNILNSVGMTDPLEQTGYNGGLQTWNWVAAMVGSLLCERVGRRKLWLTSAIGMLVSFIIITGCSAGYAELGNKAAGTCVLAFVLIYFGFYGIAFANLIFAYPLEVLPFSLRTKGFALLYLGIGSAATFNLFVNPIALAALAWRYYFIYIGILVAAIVSIYYVFPETKGMLLEEVAVLFDGGRLNDDGYTSSHDAGKDWGAGDSVSGHSKV